MWLMTHMLQPIASVCRRRYQRERQEFIKSKRLAAKANAKKA